MTDEEGLPTAAPQGVEGHEVREPAVSAEPVEPVEPVEPAEPEAATSTEGAPRSRRGLIVMCVILGLAAVGFAVIAAVATQRLESVEEDREDAERLSGRFAEALLTYDYEKLDEAKQRVLSMSTGNFRQEYERAFDGGLDVLFKETQARSAGEVAEVFVGRIEDDAVTTIAVVDAVARGTSGSRRLMSSYVQLSLVKVKGEWKVDGVTNLNLAAPTSDATTPGSTATTGTTATTAPN